jgi:outer membrane lipoprotein SlyB
MPERPGAAAPSASVPRAAACQSCGRIEKIEIVQSVRPATRTGGAVLGGVVGGVLTDTHKGTSTSTAGTTQKSFRLFVRMDDGRHLILSQAVISPNLKVGSPVRLDRGRVMLMR